MTGEYIKEKREGLGLSQKELASRVGVGKNTIYNYENGGKIPDSKIPILERVLNTNIERTESTEEKESTLDRFEDIVAEKVIERLGGVIKKVLESHQRIIKEVGEQSLDIDELQDEVKELKEIMQKTYKEVTQH